MQFTSNLISPASLPSNPTAPDEFFPLPMDVDIDIDIDIDTGDVDGRSNDETPALPGIRVVAIEKAKRYENSVRQTLVDLFASLSDSN